MDILVQNAKKLKHSIIAAVALNPTNNPLPLSRNYSQKKIPPKSLVVFARPVEYYNHFAEKLPNCACPFSLDQINEVNRIFSQTITVWVFHEIMYKIFEAQYKDDFIANWRKFITYHSTFPDSLPNIAEKLSKRQIINIYVVNMPPNSMFCLVLHDTNKSEFHLFACTKYQLKHFIDNFLKKNFVINRPNDDDLYWLGVISIDTWINGI